MDNRIPSLENIEVLINNLLCVIAEQGEYSSEKQFWNYIETEIGFSASDIEYLKQKFPQIEWNINIHSEK